MSPDFLTAKEETFLSTTGFETFRKVILAEDNLGRG